MKKGIWYAVFAYIIWGLFPIYWKQLESLPALQLIGHRILWSFLTLVIVISIKQRWHSLQKLALKKRIIARYSIAALLISSNWLTYIWAVNSGYIVEASLGYFINPLLSVLLGVIFFHEKLRPLQWLPILLVLAGVIQLTITHGTLPWISLILALTFGLYGMVKKTAPLQPLFGLTIETGVLFAPALLFLISCSYYGNTKILGNGIVYDLLIISSGILTTVPLLMFSSATKRIPLSLIGILQYITPTMQFLIGIFFYNEPFSRTELIGYCIVWIALIIFAVESYLNRKIKPVIGTIE